MYFDNSASHTDNQETFAQGLGKLWITQNECG